MQAHQLTLSGVEGHEGSKSVVARVINPTNNLPMLTAYSYSDVGSVPGFLNAIISTVSSENMSLSEAQKELVRWHNKLNHISYKRIQSLKRSGTLAHSQATRHLHTAACKLADLSTWAACQFGKQKRRPTPGKRSSVIQDKEGVLRQDHRPQVSESQWIISSVQQKEGCLEAEARPILTPCTVVVASLWTTTRVMSILNSSRT